MNSAESKDMNLRNIIRSSFIAIANQCSFIECLSEDESRGMNHVQLAVYLKVVKRNDGGESELVTVWGPDVSTGKTNADVIGELDRREKAVLDDGSGAVVVDGKTREEMVAGNSYHEYELNGIGVSNLGQQRNLMNGGTPRHAAGVLEEACKDEGEKTEEATLSSKFLGSSAKWLSKVREIVLNGECVIPSETVAKCLSYFIDGNGRTRHVTSLKSRGMQSINGRMLNRVLKNIYDLHRIEEMQANDYQKSPKKNSIRYMTLIPNVLRRRYVTYEKLELLRDLNGEHWISYGMEKVMMELVKADRNRKEVTFAAIAILLHCRPELICPVLEELARKGILHQGCEIWSHCEGDKKCLDGLLHEVKLFDLSSVTKKSVGKAIVDPFSTFFMGNRVGDENIVVRITEVCSDGEEMNGIPISQVVGRSFIWKLKEVERVQLLGPVGEVWGSAVLVSNSPELLKRWFNTKFEDATLVCRVAIDPQYVEEFYPFSVWYGHSLKTMRKVHFADERVPIRLGDISVKTRALLWHSHQTLCGTNDPM